MAIRGRHGLWQIQIGLEIHAQILCKTKLFSNASCNKLETQPNTRVDLFDAALPGSLPVLNQECVTQTIRTGIALQSTIQNQSFFERKHYYYCDMPTGYQITQQRGPLATGGHITLENTTVRINRIQLEQDSGKSIHDLIPDSTLIDLNRAGSALMEIVCEPDITTPEEAGEVIKTLQGLLRHVGTCDGQMEDGSMRCDLNVSVKKVGKDVEMGERVEIKNMNSIRNVVRAATYEGKRQVEALENGDIIEQETRTYDAVSGKTRRMRKKESAADYRFFPEPDLPPLSLSKEYIQHIIDTMPELPQETEIRLQNTYGLTSYETTILLAEMGAVDYYEAMIHGTTRSPKLVINWLLNDLFGLLRLNNIPLRNSPVSSDRLGELLDLIEDSTISGKIAKVFTQPFFVYILKNFYNVY